MADPLSEFPFAEVTLCEKGYVRTPDKFGCLQVCDFGQFFFTNSTATQTDLQDGEFLANVIFECKACAEGCDMCIGELATECLACEAGYEFDKETSNCVDPAAEEEDGPEPGEGEEEEEDEEEEECGPGSYYDDLLEGCVC